MGDFSEIDMIEYKLKQLIKELCTTYKYDRYYGRPRNSSHDRFKYNRHCKNDKYQSIYNKYHGACTCTKDEAYDTGTDSEFLEESASIDSTLKQLQRIEKELKKKEILLKEKELQDRIAGIKLKLAKENLQKKISVAVINKEMSKNRKASIKSEKNSVICECNKKISEVDTIKTTLADIFGCNKNSSLLDLLGCTKKNITSLKADSCECPPKKVSIPKVSLPKTSSSCVCDCMKKKINFKTACCETESSLTTFEPKKPKKKVKKEKKKKCTFKEKLHKWCGRNRSPWTPCKCNIMTQPVSSLEKIMQEAYGDCFPMALRGNRQIRMYDPPQPSKKPGQYVWYRSMCLFLLKLFCSPCLLCFESCYSCCSPADDYQDNKSDSSVEDPSSQYKIESGKTTFQ